MDLGDDILYIYFAGGIMLLKQTGLNLAFMDGE